MRWIVICATIIGGHGCSPAEAAELRMRPQCRPQAGVVRLGDVVEISSSEAAERESLCALELFPAPTGDRKRVLSVRELQDLLSLQGVNLANHTLSGARQAVVLGELPPSKAQPRLLPGVLIRQATQSVEAAILRQLASQGQAVELCKVAVALNDEQVRLVAYAQRPPEVVEAHPAEDGLQDFTLRVETASGPVPLAVSAQVTLPPSAVVAVRALPRGSIVGQDDVQLQAVDLGLTGVVLCQHLEEVVGKETLRPIVAGAALDAGSLRPPLLVRRGDVVAVYARSSGIQVRTTAKARGDGCQGEMILVESTFDRATLYARVTGKQQVEAVRTNDER